MILNCAASRLKHLRQQFDEYIRPSIRNLPDFSGWDGVLGLIEDREGRIIMLIDHTAREMSSILENVRESTLAEAIRKAGDQRRTPIVHRRPGNNFVSCSAIYYMS